VVKHFCHSDKLCAFIGLQCVKGEKNNNKKMMMMMMMKRNEERNKSKSALAMQRSKTVTIFLCDIKLAQRTTPYTHILIKFYKKI
jgi:hypothetical protein